MCRWSCPRYNSSTLWETALIIFIGLWLYGYEVAHFLIHTPFVVEHHVRCILWTVVMGRLFMTQDSARRTAVSNTQTTDYLSLRRGLEKTIVLDNLLRWTLLEIVTALNTLFEVPCIKIKHVASTLTWYIQVL